ncbi:MAG: hypothetical protein FD149_2622 [Rhodospirillaceae bacterium]|nr:MAG: hypothetical protein FD149_2622 [Rhodospirillaceae bacterium]
MKRYAAIGEVSEALGVSISPLRGWERDGTGIPERTAMPRMRHDRDMNAAITLKNRTVNLKNRTPRCQPVERKALALVARPERNQLQRSGNPAQSTPWGDLAQSG